MNEPDFSSQLQRRTPKALPETWRAEILGGALAAHAKARCARPENRGAEMGRGRAAWIGLAAAWAITAVFQFAGPRQEALGQASPDARNPWREGWQAHRRAIAELLAEPLPGIPDSPQIERVSPGRSGSRPMPRRTGNIT